MKLEKLLMVILIVMAILSSVHIILDLINMAVVLGAALVSINILGGQEPPKAIPVKKYEIQRRSRH